jgi:translation initiation factor IF-2
MFLRNQKHQRKVKDRMRVHELAKELELNSKELLAKLHEMGVEAKSHMSTLDETMLDLIKSEIKGESTEEAAPEVVADDAPAKELLDDSEYDEQDYLRSEEREKVRVTTKAGKADKKPDASAPDGEKIIKLKGAVTVKELAVMLGVKANKVVAELMGMNVFASINERIDIAMARKVAEKFDFEIEHEKRVAEYVHVQQKKKDAEEEEAADKPEDMMLRPPVVTFLGHVDHGKTSLLDKIRDAKVASGEHGGITQHIGAYSIEAVGKKITFLDTPGHAAFTAMRARGAHLTDVAVIVVAADDGLMPQTKEAIMHAKDAGVAILVAINKMDLPGANAERVKQQLQGEELAPEDWGGETVCVEVSAETGAGIDHLLEMILLQADILDLKASPKRRAEGFVVEARMEPGMGPSATMLISTGTLKVGDPIVCGRFWGRVKALVTDHGIKVKSCGPGEPIMCLGLSGIPEAGAEFKAVKSDRLAKSTAEAEALKQKQEQVAPKRASLTDIFEHLAESEKQELKIIIKADTQGSVEAITNSLEDIKSEKVALNIILGGTGNVTVNDVMLASASRAVILGFHVAKEPKVDSTARHEDVDIRMHHIIYTMLEDVESSMLALLEPEFNEILLGHADLKEVFGYGKNGKVAGCYVTDGRVTSKSKVRVHREGAMIFEGAVENLKHFKADVAEMKEGQECGVVIAGYKGIAAGDKLEFYILEEQPLSL